MIYGREVGLVLGVKVKRNGVLLHGCGTGRDDLRIRGMYCIGNVFGGVLSS